MILDGKKFSEELREHMKKEINSLVESGKKRPGLAVVIVGEDKASQIYVASKIKYCNEIGIKSEHVILKSDATEEELLKEINRLNNDETIHGILVQLPLPEHLDSKKIIESILPSKDVDCFTTTNIGEVFLGEKDTVYPCTPLGIVEILKKYDITIQGKDVTIIGRSNIVGKPLALMMINEGATVTVCNSKTNNLKEKIKAADIVVAAVGRKDFITGDMIKDGAVVIDVGINRVEGKIYGDVDYENVSKKASFITPVPGGVGPMTVSMLFKNCLSLYKKIEVR